MSFLSVHMHDILLHVMYAYSYTCFHIMYCYAQEKSTVCSIILNGARKFLIEGKSASLM